MNNTKNELINVGVQTEEMRRQAIMRLLNEQTDESTMEVCRVSIAKPDEVPNEKEVYEVRGAKYVDKNTKLEYIGLVVKTPDGEISDVIKISKKKLIRSNTALDVLCDYSFGFGQTEIDTICTKLKSNLDKLPAVNVTTKMTFAEIYLALYQYVISPEKETDAKTGFIEKKGVEYCYIDRDSFEERISGLNCGYTALEIQKMFKEKNMLYTNKNRPYDYAMTDSDKQQYRVIAFKSIQRKGDKK